MAKWRVWNEHPTGLTHVEKFREEMITIPHGKYELMDYEDAVQFRGQYFPMKKNAQGAPDPAGFKVLRLEKHEDAAPVAEAPTFVCHLDGQKFPTQALLDQHIATKYGDIERVKDPNLDEELEIEKKTAKGKKSA